MPDTDSSKDITQVRLVKEGAEFEANLGYIEFQKAGMDYRVIDPTQKKKY